MAVLLYIAHNIVIMFDGAARAGFFSLKLYDLYESYAFGHHTVAFHSQPRPLTRTLHDFMDGCMTLLPELARLVVNPSNT